MSTPTEGFDLAGEKKVTCEVRDEWDQPGEGKSEETSRQRQWPYEKGLVEESPEGPGSWQEASVARIEPRRGSWEEGEVMG